MQGGPGTALALLAGAAAWVCADGAPAPAAQLANVIPAPASVIARSGIFVVRDGTRISIPQGREAARIAAYFASLVRASHGLRLRVRREGAYTAGAAAAIVLRLEPPLPGATPGSYRLEVSPAGIVVSAGTPRGLFYGAVTLWQLISAQPRAEGGGVRLAALAIDDQPRFRWRALMLDSARHFQSPAFVMRYIDWMALHKLDVLGWHLTDDQGWRLEIKRYPRLTGIGAWRVPAGRAAQRDIDPATGRARLYGGFYTRAEVRRIVAHAAERYVTIVPEIDLPAHATAALIAYPALAARREDLPQVVPSDWGTYPHLCNIDDSTFNFIERVLDEVMALFPGEFLHLGGDEVQTDEWQASPAVRARMRALGILEVSSVQGYFERRLGRYLEEHGRRMIGWDEIVDAGLGPNATVLSWRGVRGAILAARAGHDAVLATDPTLYFDHLQGSSPDEPPGRGAVVSLEDVYRFDLLPAALAPESGHLLGLQANLWTEHVRTEERAAYMTWPRAAAVAELGWSPAGALDWNGFLERLPAEFERYRTLGVHYSDDVFRPVRIVGGYERHMSQDLRPCTGKLVLNLEDDAPLHGTRAVFLVDIEDPCWIFPATDLSDARSLTAAVGQVPFNFQLGSARAAIRLEPPHTAAGELEVRLDDCEGAPIASLPLAAAADNDAVTVLPAAALPLLRGVHALCLRFTQRTLDPLWTIDWVQLAREP